MLPRSVHSSFAFLSPSLPGLLLRGSCRDEAAVPEPGKAHGVSASMGWWAEDPSELPDPTPSPSAGAVAETGPVGHIEALALVTDAAWPFALLIFFLWGK